jgi:hypothetical protein
MLRTRVTLKPGRPGTKKLLAEYGSKLICVRYRYDDERKTRCKTIEIVIDEIPWPPSHRPPSLRPTDEVDIRLTYDERALREAVKHHGGRWNPQTKTWTIEYSDALALRLTDRIVSPPPLPGDGKCEYMESPLV